MIDSIINCKDISQADAVLLAVGYDRTASHLKGAALGPKAILKALAEDVEFFERISRTEPGYLYKVASSDLGNLNNLSPEKMLEEVSKVYKKIISNKCFPILLGGEHSVSLGALKTLSEKYNPESITILQIDAHPDLRDDDSNSNPNQTIPSKYAHACVMRRAHEMGFNIVQVGIRSYAKEEFEFFSKEKKIKVFEWGIGPIPTIKKIINSIKTKKVYLSIDVDGFDPAHMPATGTPVPGGIEWYYGINLIKSLIEQKNVLAVDIVEVAPRSNEVLTEFSAAMLCNFILGQKLLKKDHLNEDS